MDSINIRFVWKNFIKSYIWILLPLCIYGSIYSCSEYIEAGTHLTPYSVSVSGYYRKDGTYIRPYNRRPPGGVNHDAPYENLRFWMGSLFVLSVIVGIVNTFYFYSNTTDEIRAYERAIEDAENKKRAEEKEKHKNHILVNLSYHFNDYRFWPQNLYVGVSFNRCKLCYKYINRDEFYIAYKAIKYHHYVCIQCVAKNKSIGRNQPSTKYVDELRFVENFKKKYEQFEKDFITENQSSSILFSVAEIKNIYLAEVKKKCSVS